MSAPNDQLSERLAALERREAIRDLLYAYGRGCDRNDAAAVAALFATDGELLVGSETVTGRAAISDWYRSRLTAPSKHFVTNVAISPTGEQTTVHSEFLAPTTRDGQTTFSTGTYDDVVVFASGEARFAQRRIALEDRITIARTS